MLFVYILYLILYTELRFLLFFVPQISLVCLSELTEVADFTLEVFKHL